MRFPREVNVPERLLFRYISWQAALSGAPGHMIAARGLPGSGVVGSEAT
jgi:hypothetical protein